MVLALKRVVETDRAPQIAGATLATMQIDDKGVK